MAPARKKQKTNNNSIVEKFTCFSCDSHRSSSQFPDYNPTPDCDHLINTCKACLKKWVEVNVEGATFATGRENGEVFGVKCPQCDGIMRNVNIEIAATKKIHERFYELERKHIAESTPGWRWCLSSACRAGQVHDSQVPKSAGKKKPTKTRSKAADKTTNEPNICVCHECGAKACANCNRPFHDGESCSEYQARIKGRVDEEDKSLNHIRKNTKACPNVNCGKRIEKNGGCPMMQCTACYNTFCWNCEEVVRDGPCGCTRAIEARRRPQIV